MIKNRKKELNEPLQIMFDNEVSFIVEQICKSQKFVRTKLQDVAMVSLRDVERCLNIFVWLANKYFADTSNIRQCLVISMGICYYYRLKPKEREEYKKEMTTQKINFLEVLERERDLFCNALVYPPGNKYITILYFVFTKLNKYVTFSIK
ncbi:hypothetical protein RFI_35800 [Reticulomyxa filosa]|uniref:Cyclin N-terminal domain-containing protein n=1 Tax=Reticulomyxa filosa TaxID=46433 RepID=X6LJ40_RETFI|nr:hypothetical protein RFI_35800 [Reticulomyxa filosa]|eukprot:ETO01639.1 hypothetical protein RFI_35800 [Reticulomyxa filosa]